MNSPHSQKLSKMATMEKVAWLELVISTLAIITSLLMIPFFGDAASSAFAILGAVILSLWILRHRNKSSVVDERDLAIEEQSKNRGVEAAWWFLVLALIVIVMWPRNGDQSEVITKTTLNWLIWIQFAFFIGVKGLFGVLLYRRQTHAS